RDHAAALGDSRPAAQGAGDPARQHSGPGQQPQVSMAMPHAGTGTRSLRALVVSLLLSLIAIPDGLAGEWETVRESYDTALKAQARRIAEIEARERGGPAGAEKGEGG